MNVAPSPAAGWVTAAIESTRLWQEPLYRDLHEHPELSHQEYRTASIVADRLRELGFDVHEGVGETGVVGVLRNGEGPSVLLRADMDALPVEEQTGLGYASTQIVTDQRGQQVPVMHACGHDLHVTALLGAAAVLAGAPDRWRGTVIALFQPAEETGGGAASMVADGLAELLGRVDVALAQHVLPLPAGIVATRPGAVLSAADSLRVTVYGRGGHGSAPQSVIDPVVLASMIVIRLQTVVAREVSPMEPAILTVGRIQAGARSNIVSDHAVLEMNIRSYSEETRAIMLAAVRRIVDAECMASGSPKPAEIETIDRFPLTVNDPGITARVREAFDAAFGEQAHDLALLSPSEDFSYIPDAFGAPYTFWGVGGIDPALFERAEAEGRIAQDVPTNHSPFFAPAIQPTLDTATRAMTIAALAHLMSTPNS